MEKFVLNVTERSVVDNWEKGEYPETERIVEIERRKPFETAEEALEYFNTWFAEGHPVYRLENGQYGVSFNKKLQCNQFVDLTDEDVKRWKEDKLVVYSVEDVAEIIVTKEAEVDESKLSFKIVEA